NSLNSIGAYISGGTFTNTGSMSVGTNGIAVLADMTDINMSGGTINLTGNKAVGFHLENGSNITGATGTVNVDGTDIVIFNIKGLSASIPNGLTINPTAGSTYILANIDEGLFTTGAGTLTASANSVLISGTKSGVMIGAGTVVTSTGTNSVALSADQVSTPALISPYNVEAENLGTITLGDSSAAIYVSNGASGLNSTDITVGDNSVGIFGKNGNGTGSIKNNGVITVGQNSQGLYAEGGITQVENISMINGTMANSVGMYASGVIPMLNSGTIDLSGVDSIGMFSVASPGSTVNIQNTGKIKIGNSTNPSNPAVGIYSENEDEVITNNGEIEVGAGSLGIYKFGHPTLSGTIQQNGKITVGSGGVGIYSNGDLVTLSPTSQIILQGNNEAVGVYGTNNSVITNTSSDLSIGNNNYGVVLETGAGFVNNAAVNMGTNEVLVYSTGGGIITNNFPITMIGDENIAVYATNGEYVSNTSVIDATGKIGNIGIYNKNGHILSTVTGKIYVGNSNVPVPSNPSDPSNKYAVGLYGEGAKIENHSDIEVGTGGIGIYIKDNNAATIAENYGHIILNGAGAIGLYAENGVIINEGTIDVNGNDGIGMAGVTSTLINGNNGIINLNADNGIGIYGNTGGSIENMGIINIGSGNNNIGIGKGSGTGIVNAGGLFGEGTVLGNTTINGNEVISSLGNSYPTPSIVNSGVINVSEYFTNEGGVIAIKVDPSTIRPAVAGSADDKARFVADSVQINAPYFSVSEENPVQILASFTQGTNANVYKLKDVFNPTTPGGGPNSGTIHVISKSLTWRATPEVNSLGNIDIWMEKIPYDDFTSGLWYEDFGLALDSKYGIYGISDKAIEIFNKIDMIETDQEPEFRRVMASLAGNVYANINQRENDIVKTFENSLHLLQDSTNNTKENVKISVIAGKGKNKEETDGVTDYDYTTTGVLALREVERTYKHTFGYSLGYVHTGFEFADGNESEEWVDTIQLGVHNKYKSNGWKIVNDLTGRASIHNVDRNIDWPSSDSRSEMDGTYETYSITSDNILGKEFGLGKKASIMPYGAFRAMYVTRPTFNESGLEALEVEGNKAWSAKPRAGVEVKGAVPLGAKTAWQLKGTLDLAYEYELADLNEREKARLTAIEDGYHKLSKPEDEKGTFRTRAAIGVEVEDRYGIFLTGEYLTGDDKNDYRAGVSLKAAF
ncbi:MAG: autotransporter domain-containing protein, partial [Fusobacteriales bacterium]|nr:autotransporter domain-containing protein [Fusobacteriales bacterium]